VRGRIRLDRTSLAPIAALLAFVLSVMALPWFALGEYVASGWQATWLARLALLAAVAAALLLRLGGERRRRASAALAAVALVLVAFRAALPPDFGFDFGGLEVPTERRFGLWVGMAAAAIAALAAWTAPNRGESGARTAS
jgi:hypothetical protein